MWQVAHSSAASKRQNQYTCNTSKNKQRSWPGPTNAVQLTRPARIPWSTSARPQYGEFGCKLSKRWGSTPEARDKQEETLPTETQFNEETKALERTLLAELGQSDTRDPLPSTIRKRFGIKAHRDRDPSLATGNATSAKVITTTPPKL